MDLNLPTMATVVLSSSVISVFISSAVNWYTQRRKRSRYNSYIALTLSHKLEKYAYRCLTRLEDNELYDNSGGHAGSWSGEPPKSFALPEEDYRDFDVKLLDDIFEVLQKIPFATKEISFIATVADEDAANDTFRKNTTELGNLALSLSDRLRKKYGLPYKKLMFGKFDLRTELKNKIR